MAQKLVTSTDKRDRQIAPFAVWFDTSVPADNVGSDGDFCFLYGNDGTAIYKKSGGSWRNATGGFTGWDGANSELFVLTEPADYVQTSIFPITAGDKLRVEVDGLVQYEGSSLGFQRNTVDNRIQFTETLVAAASSPVTVFVGKYS